MVDFEIKDCYKFDDLLRIIHAVGHLDLRGAGGNFHKSVPHSVFLPFVQRCVVTL